MAALLEEILCKSTGIPVTRDRKSSLNVCCVPHQYNSH